MNVTGILTINGVPITGSNTTLTIPNITTGAIRATGDINGSSLTTAGQMTSNTVQANGINSAGAITAGGVITGTNSLNTSGQMTSNTISSNGIDVINGGPMVAIGNITASGILYGKCRDSSYGKCDWWSN